MPWPGHRRLMLAACLLLLACAAPARAAAYDIPPGLPQYHLKVDIDVAGHKVHVRQRVFWTNLCERPATELVFNAHARYQVPKKDLGFTCKMLEILRLAPSTSLSGKEPALEIDGVLLDDVSLPFHYRDDNLTALVVPLPRPVRQGESVEVELVYHLCLPQKQGRWGQWQGVTFLANWVPVLAVYGECGWQPTPFVPWHQPFFNEAGHYHVRITVACEQQVACSGVIESETDLEDGRKELKVAPICVRDFAIICSERFHEWLGEVDGVKIRCLAFPEHDFYAKELVKIATEAIPVYSRWFGPYPYPQFTIAESFFGWNGNELGAMVMIDERIFNAPHMAKSYVDYLVSHEICHQWWYNVVGTHGYCETWMDEGLATYLSHRVISQKCGGKNDTLLELPGGLGWLPNIYRDNYRNSGFYGTLGRGEHCATVQPIDKFRHLANLFNLCYDKGARIVGMIEDRLGEAAFIDFLRQVYKKHYFGILRVADFQRELEEYTGQSWQEFFQHWLYGEGLCDWSIKKVRVRRTGDCSANDPVWLDTESSRDPQGSGDDPEDDEGDKPSARCWKPAARELYRVTVLLHQKAEYTEPTVLGISFDGEHFQVRLPIIPQAGVVELDDPPAVIRPLPDCKVLVEVRLPCKPKQIAVDPDRILVDKQPDNNFWKSCPRWRFTPLYLQLEETDFTTDYYRWNFVAGPWLYAPTYSDPWFTRSTMGGIRAGVYRTQKFAGGAYLAYRTDYQDVAAGVEAIWYHLPWSRTQVGFTAERSLTNFDGDDGDCSRGVLYGRYILTYSSSLYLPPFHYVEAFGTLQRNCLPEMEKFVPGAIRFDDQRVLGLHYHLNYLTPYWDPEGGLAFDVTYGYGLPAPGFLQFGAAELPVGQEQFNAISAQLSTVKSMPDLCECAGGCADCDWLALPLRWLSATRWAFRLYGASGWPGDGLYFALGGSQLFRGYNLDVRQGSVVWVGSVEWRVPVVQHVNWDCCDHIAGIRNVYLAAFYDVGNAYVNSESLGSTAQAVGAGLRLDIAWLSFIERTIMRVDVAKTVNDTTPVQVWVGFNQPF